MSNQPLLSVVIPAKDVEPYIAETLNCLLYQQIPPKDLEVVVVNDGSTDSTAEIAERFAYRFPNFRLLHNPSPTGLPAARNKGMKNCTGRYITFIDSDDWFANGHLRVLVDAIQSLDVDFVRTDVIRAAGKRRQLMVAPCALRDRKLNPLDFVVDGWNHTMVDFPNAFAGIYKRELLESGVLLFDESLWSAEDREWNWRIFLGTESFAVVDSPGPIYRRGVETSITAVYNSKQLFYIDSCAKSIRLTRSEPRFHRFTAKAGHNLFALTDTHLQRRHEMSRDIYQTLVDRVVESSELIPDDNLREIFGSFKPARAEILKPITTKINRRRGFNK
ncbi:glycosyltransferase family 2 protein [Brevibacterium daeguense]|uniref:Glycosyltransferase family 2 protein n=1 Tax=Brevibacterium daeguense TaxID=909936 RepID=A0ABP8EG44_9MICO|nr:glycosyltransferase [Brevibacterium daeguense]